MSPLINRQRSAGFTLIELLLSMTFVAVLLLTIAMTILQMGTTYNRGMTLKEVNQAARDVSDDLRRVVARSEAFAIDESGAGGDTTSFTYVKSGSVMYGGRLCTGTYSYVWNTALALQQYPTDSGIARYQDGADRKPVQFMKVPDIAKKYCAKTGAPATLSYPVISSADAQLSNELLKVGDHNLGIESFSITSSASSHDDTTGQRLYKVSYTIGSGEVDAMNSDQSACLPPGDPSGKSNLTYCNVQKFTIVLRAGNAVN